MTQAIPSSPIDTACSFLEQTSYSAKWDDSITGRIGSRFEKIPFESPLHEHIAITLRDTEKTQRIWKAYQTFIDSTLANPVEKAFQNWLKEHLFLLGCRSKDHIAVLQQNSQFLPYLERLQNFFQAVACQEHYHSKSNKHPKKIVIITTSGGGGELMVAKALKQHLETFSCSIDLVDTRQIMDENKDILYQFTNGLREGDIWSEILQKRNNPKLADEFWWKTDQLRRFIPDQSSYLLKQHIRSLQPDLILTTRYFSPGDIALSYDLNIPVRFVHCDYRFAPELLPFIEKIDPHLVHFWVPSPECIPPSVTWEGRVKVLGYPLRLGIQKFEHINRLSHGIQPEQKVVMMMMGRHGMEGTLLPLIQKLSIEGSSLGPLYIIVICGRNTHMQEQISSYIKKTQFPHNICLQVLGSLDEDKMSIYYNMTDVFVGKAGGCVTAEIIQMGIKALIPESYELEIANRDHLVSLGLGKKLNPEHFIEQLQKLLKASTVLDLKIVDWKVRLQEELIPLQ